MGFFDFPLYLFRRWYQGKLFRKYEGVSMVESFYQGLVCSVHIIVEVNWILCKLRNRAFGCNIRSCILDDATYG